MIGLRARVRKIGNGMWRFQCDCGAQERYAHWLGAVIRADVHVSMRHRL